MIGIAVGGISGYYGGRADNVIQRIIEVILSFLGVGMEEGEASWGQMINQAKLELMRADPVWWQIGAATGAMFVLLLCVNLFTDALRDALDPRLRD